MKEYVCAQCEDEKRACRISPAGNRLPVMCGPDHEGKMTCCKWMEVPEAKTLLERMLKR